MIHVVVHYLYPDAEDYMRFLCELAPQHQHVLIWGAGGFGQQGSLAQFRKVDYEPKLAIRYSRNRMGLAIFNGLAGLGLEPEPIYITEYDHLPLLPDYADYILDELGDAGILGKGCGDKTLGNWGQVAKHADEPFMDWIREVSLQADDHVWGCQGNGTVISWEFFQAIINMVLPDKPFEMLFATMAYHMGFEAASYAKERDPYLRYGARHIPTEDVLEWLASGNVPFCHPHKVLEDRPMIYEAILERAHG